MSKLNGLDSWMIVDKQTIVNPAQSFLKGCFLLNKETLKAINLQNPESWLVLSASEIGQNSTLILQRMDNRGRLIWIKELPITSFKDIQLTGNNLLIHSSMNNYVNGEKQSDLLLSIELKTGAFKQADLK